MPIGQLKILLLAFSFFFSIRFVLGSFVFVSLAFGSPCEEFDNALKMASEIRGLKILKPATCKVINKEQFAKLMQESYAENLTLKKLELEEKASQMTGLIPQDYDYSKCYLENNLESVMATYFPNHKTVYIDDKSEATLDLLVHEATHVLQDQHFNLSNKSKLSAYSTDSSYAFLALAEGDAELVQLQFLETQKNNKRKFSEESNNSAKNICELPQSLLFQLDFPYFWGARYARTLESIDRSFSNYPKFSTQILYPGKSFNFRQPSLKETFNLVKSQYKQELIDPKAVYEDSWGEYTLRCLLRELIGSRFAVIAGYGWNGDKIALYKFKSPDKNIPQQHVMSWILKMQHQTDAIELFQAFKLSLEKRFNLKFDTSSDTILYGNDRYSKIFLRYKNDTVEFLVSDHKL